MLMSCGIREPNSHFAVVKDGVVGSHEDVTQYPASVSRTGFRDRIPRKVNRKRSVDRSWSAGNVHDSFLPGQLYSPVYRSYQRGPIGGGMSRAENPLMQCAMNPSPTLRMYCSTTGRSYQICWGFFGMHSITSWIKQQVYEMIQGTWSGRSSNALPPMLNATVCRESTCLQSTCDPTGSGMFPQSCPSTHLLVRHVRLTNAKRISDSRDRLSPCRHTPKCPPWSCSSWARFASRRLSSHMHCI